MKWRDYHQATKHTIEALRRNQRYLDWANMPNPFRHYDGVPVLDLPADPPNLETPALEVLGGISGTTHAEDGAAFLSQLMFYSASISASKRAGASAYALRVNPSSGNLHPTEFHFATRGLVEWPDGLYHYRPSSHMAEQRALGDFGRHLMGTDAPLLFVLTSIAWREAWKYGERAYRYCLHDIGHAWQSLTLAARAMGCESLAIGNFADDQVSETAALHDDEWPMLLVAIRGSSIPLEKANSNATIVLGGIPNRLSEKQVHYPLMDIIHAATKLEGPDEPSGKSERGPIGRGEIKLPHSICNSRSFGDVVRTRRSALDFRGGRESMPLAQLATLLATTAEPLFADFAVARFVQVYLYVHRVEGLERGVYRHWPEHGELEVVRHGDQRLAAAALSLKQDLAGNACVAFSMIGDCERATKRYGDRGYRYVHFEAGAIGHRMYLAAEALGMRATGIGAFFDDQVHEYLSLTGSQRQVVYHFAVGHPVPDPRLDA